jgi:hypothetical protein
MNRVFAFLLLLPMHVAFAGHYHGLGIEFSHVYQPDSLYETAGKAIAIKDGMASPASPVTILSTAHQLIMLKAEKNNLTLIYGAPVPNSRALIGKPFTEVMRDLGPRFQTVHASVSAAAETIKRRYGVEVFENASPQITDLDAMTTVAWPLNPDLSGQELSQFMNLLVQSSKVCWAGLVDSQTR